MSFTIEKLPGEPIVLLTTHKDIDISHETSQIIEQAVELFDSLDEPVFYIVDMTHSSVDLEDLLVGASAVLVQKYINHPNMREMMIVSSDEAVHLSVQGFDSDAFGNVKAQIFTALADALDYARDNA